MHGRDTMWRGQLFFSPSSQAGEELCLPSTYLEFQGKFYEQLDAAMGSPLSPVIANIYMEHLRRPPYGQPHFNPHFGLDMWNS